MLLAAASKAIQAGISLYLGSLLSEEGIDLEGIEPSTFTKLYREVHFKSVIILPLENLNLKDKVDVFSQAKITKKTLFVEKVILDFTFGIKFTGYQFRNQELCLIRSYDYLTLTKNTLSRDAHCRFFQDITSYSLDARHAVVLDAQQNLRTLVYLKDRKIYELEDKLLDTGVKCFVSNYNYLAYQTVAGEVFLLVRFSNLNLGQMAKYRVHYPGESIVMHLGINFYLRTVDDKQIYMLALSQLDPVALEGNQVVKSVTPTEYSAFPVKQVGRIFTGLRNEIVEVTEPWKKWQDWSNDEVRKWFQAIGVRNIDGLLQHEKLVGEDLQKINPEMLLNRFGITNTDVHNKIASEIQHEQFKQYQEPVYFGLGYNQDGQFGLNNGNKNLTSLTKINLPKLSNTDRLKQVQFGLNNTLITTDEGRIFMSFKKTRAKAAEGEVEEEEPVNKRNRSQPKMNRKVSGNQQRKNSSTLQETLEPNTPGLNRSRKASKRVDTDESDGFPDDDEDSNGDSEEDNNRAKGKKKRNQKATEKKRGLFREKHKYVNHKAETLKDKEKEDFDARWVELTNLFTINRNFRKSGLLKVSLLKDQLMFFVSSKPEVKRFNRTITDPVCMIKTLKSFPHYEGTRYLAKLNGEWLPLTSLEESQIQEGQLRKIEAFKFVPSNTLIWNSTDRIVDFSPY